MSKTGGGRGTNQYAIKGVSKARTGALGGQSRGRRPEPPGSVLGRTFSALDPNDIELTQFGHHDLADVPRETTEEVCERYVFRRALHIHETASLEGNTFTLPEVVTLLEERTIEGEKLSHDAIEIINIAEATYLVEDAVKRGKSRLLERGFSDDINRAVMTNLSLDPGVRRPASRINSATGNGATVNVMGDTFYGYRIDELSEVADVIDERLSTLKHPITRALNYAAFASYAQFYLDGNKRTARFVMDAELMSHGYNGIAVPYSRKNEYSDALAEMFRTGRLASYTHFLLDCAKQSTAR